MQTPTRPNRLREHREEAGLVQEDLAAALGVRARTISRYETGESFPRFREAQRIAAFFSVRLGRPVKVDDLFPQPEEVVA